MSASGTWEFESKLPDEWARYENQAGVLIRIPSPHSVAGTNQRVRLVVERRPREAPRMLFYVGFPDVLDRNYVLTKQS